ncbi:transposase, partial [Kocuria carniphila]|uniref:transposase n=1 Tax=Kocuria carniphila TaxID=262208 RepID=UPI0034CE198C
KQRPQLRDFVEDKLGEDWAPEQIAGHLRRVHEVDEQMWVSHETIYRSLYISRWRLLPKHLSKRLRTRRPIRKHKHHSTRGQWRSTIKEAVSIHDRPAATEDRSEPGHWEGVLGADPP